MKAYKMADLAKKDTKTLQEDMAKLTAELNEVRVKATMRKMSDDSSQAKKIKKQIARIKTALNAQVEEKPKAASAKKEEK